MYAPKEVYLPYGQPAVLDCHFRSNPPLTNLRWEKDGFLFDPYNVQVNYISIKPQISNFRIELFPIAFFRVFSIVVMVAFFLTVLMNRMVVAIHVHHTMNLAPRAHPH